MKTEEVLFEFDITKEQQQKLDNLCKKWGVTEAEVIRRIIEIEISSIGRTDKETVIKISNNSQSEVI